MVYFVFVDKDNNDFFDLRFVDEFSAEEYARRHSCKGKALRIEEEGD